MFDQKLAEELAGKERLLLIAGQYEGFDERIIDGLKPMEVSIGDYVLSGGELAAMVVDRCGGPAATRRAGRRGRGGG